MTIERQRDQIVRNLLLASLAQDTSLLLANTATGAAKFFNAIATSFANYAQTFGWVFNDQQQKYEALTGRSFAGRELGQGDDDDDD